MTGATGFFGRWIAESVHFIESALKSENQYVLFSRQKETSLKEKMPVFGASFFKVLQRDLTEKSPDLINVDYALHAASEVYQFKSIQPGLYNYSAAYEITQNLLSTIQCKKIVYLSSGAVYEPKESAQREEDQLISYNLSQINSYGAAKRASEVLIEKSGKPYVTARCFSFVGPWGDKKMAVNDMLEKALQHEKISVRSPEVIRSYLYMTDLVVAVMTLLFSDTQHSVYNIGSNQPISMIELARKICDISQVEPELVEVDGKTESKALAGKVYWPNTDRYQLEFGPLISADLDQSLEKTYKFLKISQAV